MKKQVVLLRIGVDAGCGGIQGPLFEDQTFEFICIPDQKSVSIHTYGNMVGLSGTRLADFFPESRRDDVAAQTVHVDPEWETFTYGDPTTPKRSLRRCTQSAWAALDDVRSGSAYGPFQRASAKVSQGRFASSFAP